MLKNQPTEPIEIHASEHLRFVYEGRANMTFISIMKGFDMRWTAR